MIARGDVAAKDSKRVRTTKNKKAKGNKKR